MYRIEMLKTNGKKSILLVCEDGMGLKDFKILEKGDDYVKIGYVPTTVRTMCLVEYIKGTYKTVLIEQSYYLLDLDKNKIFRLERIGGNSRIDNGAKTKKLYLGKYPGTKMTIRTTRNFHYLQASITDENGLKPFTTDATWVNLEEMPGTMIALTFEHGEIRMHEISCAVFLQ